MGPNGNAASRPRKGTCDARRAMRDALNARCALRVRCVMRANYGTALRARAWREFSPSFATESARGWIVAKQTSFLMAQQEEIWIFSGRLRVDRSESPFARIRAILVSAGQLRRAFDASRATHAEHEPRAATRAVSRAPERVTRGMPLPERGPPADIPSRCRTAS